MTTAWAENDRQYEHALGAFKSGNYGSAELLFKKIIESSDDEYLDRAWFYYARSIYRQKKFKSAIFEFNNFVNKSRTTSLSNESRFWMGESYYNLKEYIKAIEEYNRFISIGAENKLVPAAHDRIASIYFIQKRYDEAIMEWNSSILKSKNRKNNAYRVFRIGDAFFREKKYEESLQRLYPLLTARVDQKSTAMAQLLIGRIYQKNGNHGKALSMFGSIPNSLLKDKRISAAYYFQGLSYIQLKEPRKAVTLLDLYLMIGKGTTWYYNAKYEMGRLLVKSEDVNKGIELLEDVRVSSSKEYLKLNAAKILSDVYIEKNPSKAIPYLEQSLVTDNQERRQEVMILLARAYLKIRDYDNCDTMLKQYREKYPFDDRIDEVIFLSSRVSLEKGDMNKALQELEKIEKDYPFSKYLVESKFYIAYAKSKHGKTKEVVTYLNSYLSNQNIKHQYNANILLADAYLDLNDSKNAEQVINRIMTKYIDQEGVEKSIYSYALATESKGNNPWKYYNIIMARFPKTPTAMNMFFRIGNGFYKEKKYREAILFYDKYLSGDLKKERGAAFFNRLQSLFQLNQYGDVIATLEKGNLPTMDENQWEQIPLLASRSHFHLNNYDEVYNNFYIDSLSKYKNGDLYMFAKSAIAVGDDNTAGEIAKYLKQDSEQYQEIIYMIASHHRKNNDMVLAKQLFAKVIAGGFQGKWTDKARVNFAEIYIRDKDYTKAIELLSKVTEADHAGDKNALMTLSMFGNKENDKALAFSQSKILSILGSEYGEEVVKANIEYYFNSRNTQRFNQFIEYMKRFKGNSDYVYFKSGQFSYVTKQFNGAFNSYNRLASSDSPYRDESNYYLGKIALFYYKNSSMALKFFGRVADSENDGSVFKWKSKINIALILNENKDSDKVRKELTDVIEKVERGTVLHQAVNLREYFGL